MSVLATNFECSECQRVSLKIAEIQTKIRSAKSELQESVEAADGTSALKYNELQALLKVQDQVLSEMQAHEGQTHPQFMIEGSLTRDGIET
jgi:hypothetical protein